MSRKSRAALAIEKLSLISNCPTDLFNKIEPNDELFDNIEKAEKGDVFATEQMMRLTLQAYANDSNKNQAMLYYVAKGFDLGCDEAAEAVVYVAAHLSALFERLEKAIYVIKATKYIDEELDERIERALIKSIIAQVSESCDFDAIIRRLGELKGDTESIELYLIAAKKQVTGKYNAERVIFLAKELGMPGIVGISYFSGEPIADKRNMEAEKEALIRALELIDADNYRDFWLKCIYEYCNLYLGGDYISFAEPIAHALEARCYCKDGKLHLLAWCKYISEHPSISGKMKRAAQDRYSKILDECKFEGMDREHRDAHLESAIYTSASEMRKIADETSALGYIIQHTKNRFSMAATLSGHAKRGKCHMWEITISIDSAYGVPAFKELSIIEHRNTVVRGGIELANKKKLTQVICLGEIVAGGKVSPFEMDLILDISYVSSTKCDSCEIRVRKLEQNEKYTTMRCQLYIC